MLGSKTTVASRAACPRILFLRLCSALLFVRVAVFAIQLLVFDPGRHALRAQLTHLIPPPLFGSIPHSRRADTNLIVRWHHVNVISPARLETMTLELALSQALHVLFLLLDCAKFARRLVTWVGWSLSDAQLVPVVEEGLECRERWVVCRVVLWVAEADESVVSDEVDVYWVRGVEGRSGVFDGCRLVRVIRLLGEANVYGHVCDSICRRPWALEAL